MRGDHRGVPGELRTRIGADVRDRNSVLDWVGDSVGARKVKVRMFAAGGIESSAAGRALVAAAEIVRDGHLTAAGAAQHRAHGPLGARPDLDRMVREGLVAILAGVIDTAALHPDRDDVESGSIVSAAGLRIQIDSANLRARGLHRGTDYRTGIEFCRWGGWLTGAASTGMARSDRLDLRRRSALSAFPRNGERGKRCDF